MATNQSIRRRLLTDQVALILLVGGILMATTILGARRAVESVSQTVISRALDQTEAELHRFFDPIEGVLGVVVKWDGRGLLPRADQEVTRAALEPLVLRLRQTSGLLLARADGSQRFLARREDGLRWRQRGVEEVGVDGYDPRERPWFEGAMAAGPEEISWTEPYRFFTQQTPGVTASVAYGENRDRVAAIDVDLSDLSTFARSVRVSDGGSLWIQTDDRRLLAWPEDPEIWGDADSSAALLKRPLELGLELIGNAVGAVRDSPQSLDVPVRFRSGFKDWWVAGRRFELSADRGLLIIVLVPHADLLGERANLRWWILAVTLTALAAGVIRARVLARRFSDPIEALAQQSDRIREGDFEPGEPISTRLTEVQQLADSQERMRSSLKTLMKLEGDLEVARQIQQATWPKELPELSGFEVAAWSQAADETGGDSYDVIGLDDEGEPTREAPSSLLLMLADATGHGIGPALSVTQLRAMLRMALRNRSSLDQTAAHLNEQLYADLPKNRFITAWIGRLEPDGTLLTFSGGQAPLLIYRAGRGEVEVVDASAPPLGLLPPMPVVLPPPTRLEPGDIYVVLSDGFYEAEDPGGQEFEKEGVIDVIRRHSSESVADILEALRKAVVDFTNDAPLSDDRTAVIVKRLR